MNYNRITYILRVIGAGVFLFGMFKQLTVVWIIGLAVMLAGNIIRIIMKKKEKKETEDGV